MFESKEVEPDVGLTNDLQSLGLMWWLSGTCRTAVRSHGSLISLGQERKCRSCFVYIQKGTAEPKGRYFGL